MAQPFSPEQRDAIRARLMESARRHAISDSFKKTSLDMLTSDAGISKSSFYKFFDSKELLFLESAEEWKFQIFSAAQDALKASENKSDQERAAAMICTMFQKIYSLGIVRFLSEDWSELIQFVPEEEKRKNFLSSSQYIFDILHQNDIHFTEPDEIVLAAIQMLYLSILHIQQIGANFFPTLHILVTGVCKELVA